MSNRDLQARLLQWIQDERHKAELSRERLRDDEGEMHGYYDGMIDAYLGCFAKVEEMIDEAKKRDGK